jgi:hypothetical protein
VKIATEIALREIDQMFLRVVNDVKNFISLGIFFYSLLPIAPLCWQANHDRGAILATLNCVAHNCSNPKTSRGTL